MNRTAPNSAKTIAIVGGGPAGLAAAEVLSQTHHAVAVYDAMPTIGRKFLLAGKSGLNLTHAEDYEDFVCRFGPAQNALRDALDAFTPADVRAWADDLGVPTFVGTSGRVFPVAMKASPLLRAWRQRLEMRGVTIRTRHRWSGMVGGIETGRTLRFETPDGMTDIAADAVVLALGGASWPKLGSNAEWIGGMQAAGIDVMPMRPANCGFDVAWSDTFRARFAGAPVKAVAATSGMGHSQGEFVISRHGVEGSLVYAHAASLRDRLDQAGHVVLTLDLAPGRSEDAIAAALGRLRSKVSFANRVRKGAGLDPVKSALLREISPEAVGFPAQTLAARIKTLPLPLLRPRPIEEAISSAGGIAFGQLDASLMMTNRPGLFFAGEMLDWEAPTGGYLLTACLATGRAAARGVVDWLDRE